MAISYTYMTRALKILYGIRARFMRTWAEASASKSQVWPHLKSNHEDLSSSALSLQEEGVWSYGGLSRRFLSFPVHTRRANCLFKMEPFKKRAFPCSRSWRVETMKKGGTFGGEKVKQRSWTSGGVSWVTIQHLQSIKRAWPNAKEAQGTSAGSLFVSHSCLS